jgi:hypothetical protein
VSNPLVIAPTFIAISVFNGATSPNPDGSGIDKIIEMMSDCGLLIGNLTYCNPNVYNEIGFVMGKARAEKKKVANMLLFLDESVVDEKDEFVGFNLRGIKQIRFNAPELEFAPKLKENIEKFFQLK